MYFLSIDHLRTSLSEEDHSPRQDLAYLIGLFIVSATPFGSLTFTTEMTNWWDTLYSLGSIAVIIWGIRFCFRSNNEPSLFLSRFVAVGFVTAVRFALFLGIAMLLGSLALGLSAAFLDIDIPTEHSRAFTVVFLLAFFLVEILYYWRVGVQLSRVAKPELIRTES